jgi:N-terminal acetyltransferase B complex non-catalytic subunit
MTPPTMRPILLKLAHRLLNGKQFRDFCNNPDRFHLWLTVLVELELWEEADTLLNDELGKLFCNASLSCNELRREVMQKRGLWEEEGQRARERIQEKKSVIYSHDHVPL